MRVGDLEVSSNPRPTDENKICLNKLCFTSGEQTLGVHASYVEHDCVSPITGRFVICIRMYAVLNKYRFLIQYSLKVEAYTKQ